MLFGNILIEIMHSNSGEKKAGRQVISAGPLVMYLSGQTQRSQRWR